MLQNSKEKKMANLNDYGLTENPFALLPSSRVTNWAGRKAIRAQLMDIVQSILTTDTGVSEFVILHGSYGAGKSHALRYFVTLINEEEAEKFKATAIYVPKVKLSEKISFVELYFQIIQQLGIGFLNKLADQIRERVKKAADLRGSSLSREEEKKLLQQDPSIFINQVLNSLDQDDRQIVQLLLLYADGNEKVGQYLTGGKPVITGSDFSQPITTDYMAARVLANLFKVMTLKIDAQEPVFNGVYLFLDEVEDLLEAKATEQATFWTAIREVVNRLPYNFALLMAFSADAALLEAVIPQGLLERLSRPNIEFPALEIDEAKEFIRSHLESFRPKKYKLLQPYAPFTEDAIDFILEQIVILIPRKIFRELRIVLERAIKREGLKPGEEIDAAMAEQILLGIGS